jgi:hypothetical protein
MRQQVDVGTCFMADENTWLARAVAGSGGRMLHEIEYIWVYVWRLDELVAHK